MKNPTIFVQVPFGYGVHPFKVVKSRKWGAIDHMILQYLVQKPCTSNMLAEVSLLPKQLVVEIVIPLMQVGWVEIAHIEDGYFFQATQRGMAVATLDELPSENEPLIRVRSFLIDPITLECYRLERKQKKQPFKIYNYFRAQELLNEYSGQVAKVSVKSQYNPDLVDIFSCVANSDEEVNGFEDEVVKRNYSDSIRYAIAVVNGDDDIDGIPDISDELRKAILNAAWLQRDKIKILGATNDLDATEFKAEQVHRSFPWHEINSSAKDLILGANQHKEHFYKIINTAHSRIIIHSTFINAAYIDLLLPDLISAARRSVQIDILWGQTEPEDPAKFAAYKMVIDKLDLLQQQINREGLATQFRFHLTPTQSHAKFLIADIDENNWITTFGSCNWLSTGFNRFESSVCIRNPAVVSEALSIASRLAMGNQGLSNALSRELAILSTIVKKRAHLECPVNTNSAIKVQFLTSDMHHEVIKAASDDVKKDIFICSHRISFAAERPIITPLKAAMKADPKLSVKVVYGRTSGTMQRRDISELANDLCESGFTIVKADDPQIHAKILAWDNDNLVITSLNWLSSSSKGDIYDEVGVYLKGEDITLSVAKAFEELYGDS